MANTSQLPSFNTTRYTGEVLTASTWKPALAVGPGTGKIEKGCHSEALIAGQFT